jgi:dihydrofolate reductase
MTQRRRVIVHIATSADGYIARPDGEIEWLTSRPAPKGFYGMNAFMQSIDTMLMGRKTYEVGLAMGGQFDPNSRTIVFSRQTPPAAVPLGVDFMNGPIGPFMDHLRAQPGKDIWLMGGGELIASFLDAQAIDEFVISVVPVFIGDGIPLIARRHRHVPLVLRSTDRFGDGVVQLRYDVGNGQTFKGGGMATGKQRSAARKNIKKAAKAAKKKKTISKLPKKTRTALAKKGAKVAKQKRRRGS